MELPPLTDVPPPKYFPIDKRGDVATRPVVVVPPAGARFADVPDGDTRMDPARTAFIALLGAPVAFAADDVPEYVPAPPSDRTEAAANAPDTADVHNTQTIASFDI